MAREFRRICKKPGCSAEFVVSAPALVSDRAIGFSEPEYCPKHRIQKVKSYSRVACHHYQMQYSEEGEQLVRAAEQARIISGNHDSDASGEVVDPWQLYGPGGLGRFQRPTRAFLANEQFTPESRTFPIAEKFDELQAALQNHQVVVLVGPTGSGKSTYVPWRLLTDGVPGGVSGWARRGTICVTQPRIQATIKVARFISENLNGTTLGAGGQIGYAYSRETNIDRRTRLIFKTDGKLINDIVSGAIGQNSILMIDEAHERSANIDLILSLMRWQLPLYPHLRMVIASATIDHEMFQTFFGADGTRHVPIIEGKGRSFPITEHWWGDRNDGWWKDVNGGCPPTRDELPAAIADLVNRLARNPGIVGADGKRDDHILVFQPGSREIHQTVLRINAMGLPDLIALPLYSQLPFDDQDKALDPKRGRHSEVFGKRRVVVSTNIAETSLTVNGVRFVIDAGFVKESYWNQGTGVDELRTVRHSKAGCRQRQGRGGRVAPGDAFMMYTKRQFDQQFPDHTIPELARSSLRQIVLTAKSAGARTRSTSTGRTLALDWMPLPDEESIHFQEELQRSYAALEERNAIDSDGDLTEYGLELRGLPVELDVARIYTEAEFHGVGFEAATLVPFLKLQSGLQGILTWSTEWAPSEKLKVRQHHLDLAFGCRDDLELYLKIWLLWENIPPSEQRRWHEELGFNRDEFVDKVVEQRKRLIESVMDWRKAERRGINISRIDAFRALVGFCLREDVFQPVKQEADRQTDWDGYWDEDGAYDEYDDAVSFEDILVSGASSTLYTRVKSTGHSDADVLEIAPSSACFRYPANLLVCCGRRPNPRPHSAAKVLGVNAVRLSKSWLAAIDGTVVDRTRLFAKLSREVSMEHWQQLLVRLTLPWLIPRGTLIASADITEENGRIGYVARVPDDFFVAQIRNVKYSVAVRFTREKDSASSSMEFEVLGFGFEAGVCEIELYPALSKADSFTEFTRAHKPGDTVAVTFVRLLEDPLGFSPMFLCRHESTGLNIPLSETDLSGGTRSYSEFARRFEVGEKIEIDIAVIDIRNREVELSRGRQLYREYQGIRLKDRFVYNDELKVKRIDTSAVYVSVPSSYGEYIASIPASSVPSSVQIEVGKPVRAMFRRKDRAEDWNKEKIEHFIADRHQLPPDIDLGVIVDVRLPVAYDRFCKNKRRGEYAHGFIRKHLDSGAMLIEFENYEGLTALVFDAELGVDEDRNLLSVRAFPVGSRQKFFIYQLWDEKALVRASLLRLRNIPETYRPTGELEIRVHTVRQDRIQRDRYHISGVCPKGFAVRVGPVYADIEELPEPGTEASVIVSEDSVNYLTREIQGTLPL